MSLFGFLKGLMGGSNADDTDAFLRSYLETALWAEVDSDGEPLDRNFTVSDFTEEALASSARDCASFEEANYSLYSQIDMDADEAGNRFWLARNGHGAAFMDNFNSGSVEHDIAKVLQANARAYGPANILENDDGTLDIFVG